MSTPAPVFTWTFTSVGFLRGSSGVGMVDSSSFQFTAGTQLREIAVRIDGLAFASFLLAIAAIARGNGIAVGAGGRMAQEGADALVEFRADDVLESAGLSVRFGVVDAKVSLNKRSARRWRRTTSRARLFPRSVSCTSWSRTLTRCRSSMRASVRTGSMPPGVRMCSTSARVPSSPQIQICSSR